MAYKPWWEDELDALNAEFDDKPLSASWRSKLGQWSRAWGGGTIGGTIKTDRLADTLKRLASPANVVRNSADGQERTLTLAWSDGTKFNTPTESTIYLSPDIVINERRGSKDEELMLDAMTGQVLVGAAMKRTVSKESWERMLNDRLNGVPFTDEATLVWEALETAVARQEVLRDWSGWAAYFKRHAEEMTASKEEVQKALESYKPDVKLAAMALAWNIQYPHDKLTLPKEYRRAIDDGAETLNCDMTAAERYQVCRQAVRAMENALSAPPEPPKQEEQQQQQPSSSNEDNSSNQPESQSSSAEPEPEPENTEPQPGEGQGEQSEPESPSDGDGADGSESAEDGHTGGEEGASDADGEAPDSANEREESESSGEGGEGSDAGEPEQGDGEGEVEDGDGNGPDLSQMPEAPAELPQVVDSSMFGQPVENTTVEAPELPSPVDVDDEPLEGGEVRMPEGLGDHVETLVSFVEEDNGEEYHEEAREMAPIVSAIHAALRFRNNDTSMWNRGCTSGDLDEGSLDKLVLREDNPAIWERRELIGQPRVAVGILLDESGSMAGDKIEEARKVCIALSAALAKVKGVSLMILGHTGDGSSEPNSTRHPTKRVKYFAAKGSPGCWGNSPAQVNIYEYQTRKHKNPYGLIYSRARECNYDSFAMDYAVRKMMADYQEFPRRVLFVISDGKPNGRGRGVALQNYNTTGVGYGGEEAMKHMRQVCEFGRRNKVGVYGIGICNAYEWQAGELMYGPANFVVLDNVMDSLAVLTAFLRQIAVRPL